MSDTLVFPESIVQALEKKNWVQLAHCKSDWPEPELAAPLCLEVLSELSKRDKILFFRALPAELQVEVISSLEGPHADELLVQLTDDEASQLFEEMSDDDRAYLLDELPGKLTHRLMRLLRPEDQKRPKSCSVILRTAWGA